MADGGSTSRLGGEYTLWLAQAVHAQGDGTEQVLLLAMPPKIRSRVLGTNSLRFVFPV